MHHLHVVKRIQFETKRAQFVLNHRKSLIRNDLHKLQVFPVLWTRPQTCGRVKSLRHNDLRHLWTRPLSTGAQGLFY